MKWHNVRVLLFILVAVVQLAVAGRAIVTSELALRSGETYRFRIQPVDPVDAFRGRYVAIRMAENRAPVTDDFDVKPGGWIYLPLAVDEENYASFGQAALEPPTGEAYLKLRAGGVFEDEDGSRVVAISTTPFGRYYMNEELAPEAERAVWSGPGGQREASITVRVLNGSGVLEDLWVDGVEIHEWLNQHASPR